MIDRQQDEREQRVRERAYQLWEGQGRPAGRHDEHWHDAAREIDGSGETLKPDQVTPALDAASPPAKRKRAPRAPKPAAAPATVSPAPKGKRGAKPKAE